MRPTSKALVVVVISLGLALTGAVLMWQADRPPVSTVPQCPPELTAGFGGPLGESLWEWYRANVELMNESILACGPSEDDETYRLIWAHAFTSRSPFVVRISRHDDDVTLRAARFAWVVRPRGLTTISDTKRRLTHTEWMNFLARVRELGFWSMSGPMSINGDDGSSWLLEARRSSDYLLVARHSPDDGSFRSLAMELVRLAGFEDPEPRSR